MSITILHGDCIDEKIKRELLCRKCGASWRYDGVAIKVPCPYCGAMKDARNRRGYTGPNAAERKTRMLAWATPERQRERAAAHRALLRKRVFFKITGTIAPVCARCGCDDARLLEVNHKNGGGAKETEQGKHATRFYYAIAKGRRPTADLELLCKPCNAIHCLELRFGPLPRLRVTWQSR